MFEPAAYLTFVLACVAVVIVPGPTVTVIIANSLRHGSAAGLGNVAGTQVGLAVMLAVLAAGLQVVVEALGVVFEIVKLLGAAYLIYLGAKLLLKKQSFDAPTGAGAGGFLTRQRVRLLEVCSGCLLIGGGVWLALTRR